VKALGQSAIVREVLADWRTASISAKMRGALAFLEKLTLTPETGGPEDVTAARAAGVSDAALREVIYVCFLFSTMDRLADAFGFEVAEAGELNRGEWILRHFGYHRMSVPG
jgi:alkylhydroperoxidase family enzyme